MMTKYLFIICACLLTNVAIAQISLKRLAPKEVKSVILNNIKYTAPTDKMGFIVAKNAQTDSVLWQKRIYKIDYNNNLEIDVQDDFIDSLQIRSDSLIIHTEHKKRFSLKLN